MMGSPYVEVAGAAFEVHVETVQREDRGDRAGLRPDVLGAVRVDPELVQVAQLDLVVDLEAQQLSVDLGAFRRGVVPRGAARPLAHRQNGLATGAEAGFARVICSVHSLIEARAWPPGSRFSVNGE
jgi:hypothetical protein